MKHTTAHLRLATQSDVPYLLDLLEELHSKSVYAKTVKFNRKDAESTLREAAFGNQQNACCVILETEGRLVGMLAASWMVHVFNKSEKTAVELAFYIVPEEVNFSNLRLIVGAYRYWAKKQGCTTILMGKLKDSDTTETYTLRKL